MAISLQSVRAFVAVAEQGSFIEAARLLGIKQPTVSAAIARLEAHAKVQLFRRYREGVALTEHGQRVLAHATRLVAAADAFDASLTDSGRPALTLGFMGEAASSVTGQIIKIAQRRLNLPVQLRRFDFDDPTCGLESGKSDLAIVWPPLSGDHLDQVVIATDRRAVALPIHDPLAARVQVQPDELSGRDWVVPRSPDPMWTEFRHPRSIGVPAFAAIVDSGSVEETLELVAAGAGIALLSESTEQHYARVGVAIVPLAGNLRCTASLAWRNPVTDPAISEIIRDVRGLNLPHR